MDPEKLNNMKVPELKSALQERGLSVAGLKADLVERLRSALVSGSGAAATAQDGGEEVPSVAPAMAPETVETVSSSNPAVAAGSAPSCGGEYDPALDEEAPASAPAGPSYGVPVAEVPAAEQTQYAQGYAVEQTQYAQGYAQQQQQEWTTGAVAAAPVATDYGQSGAEVGTKREASEMDGGAQAPQQLPAKKQAVEVDPNVPYPWQQHVSARTGKFYWYNTETKETTWVCPYPKVAPSAAQPYAAAAQPYAAGAYGMPAAYANTGPLPIRPGAMKCKHFLKFGVCKFGDTCKFDHPPEEAGKELDTARPEGRSGGSMLPNGFAQTGGLPERPGEKECSYFMKTGMCKYGETCRWHHPIEKQTKEVNFVKPNEAQDAAGMAASSMGMNMMGMMPQMAQMAQMATAAASEWECHMSDTGRPYYYNPRTQESTWETPPAMLMAQQMMSGMQGMMGGFGGGGGSVKRPPPAGLVGGQHPIRPGEPDCTFFVKTGACKFGETCKFNHPPEMLGIGGNQNPGGLFSPTVAATEMTSEGYPVRPGQGDCSFYMKTGQCKFGATCKWNHPHKGVSGLPDASRVSKRYGFVMPS